MLFLQETTDIIKNKGGRYQWLYKSEKPDIFLPVLFKKMNIKKESIVMKLKKIFSIILVVITVASACVVTASAKTARTNTYYVFQEMTYGELILNKNSLNTLTYCELNRAGKIVRSNFVVSTPTGTFSDYVQDGGNYYTNTYDSCTDSSSNYAEGNAVAVNGYTFKSAKSYHKVRINYYVYWDSAQCDGNTNGYDIPYIVL